MLLLLIPLLLFALSSASNLKSDDDESLYANLNKTLLEISKTPVEELTLDELSAAHGKHIPPEHRYAAEELLRHRSDRPLGALIGDLQTFGAYTTEMAEEFSRGAMRALLDKSYMLPPTQKLEVGDHLCRCNQRQCASISNELYAVLGPEMSTFCRTDKYGHCMQTIIRTTNNTNEIELFCSHSYATNEQKDLHDTGDYKHNHLCKSVKDEGRSCCKGAMCNDMPLPLTDPQDTVLEAKVKELNTSVSMWRLMAVCLIIVVFFLLAALGAVLLILCKFDLEEVKKKLAVVSSIPITKLDETEGRIHSRYFHNDMERGSTAGSESPLIASSLGSDTMTISTGTCTSVPTKSTFVDDTTFGLFSGTGGNILANATLATYIKILEPLGQGKFGKVFLGRWRGGEKIAVKKFHSELRESFEQEVEILMSGMMSNSNILRWVGKDTVYNGHTIEHWIMMEYHPNGSLYDYMEKNELSEHTLLNMIRGIANGVSFLHSEIQSNPGTNGKKSVAHCDLKTKNILVKSDLSCVIADFGMAVIDTFDSHIKPLQGKIEMKSGTVRYLAPELLRDTIDVSTKPDRFNYYKYSDMYSLALIIWECARRTHSTFGKEWKAAHSMEESLAYYTLVPREPTLEDMIEAVAENGARPELDDSWMHNATFLGISKIVTECWIQDPQCRLSALKAKFLIDKLCREANVKCPTGYD